MSDNKIIDILERIFNQLEEQSFIQKEILTFKEACNYIDASSSYLYKLTSSKRIPHYRPEGKKLFFRKTELNEWLMRNKVSKGNSIEEKVNKYLLENEDFKF